MGGGVMRTAAKTAASWGSRPGISRTGSVVGKRSTVLPPPSASVAVTDSLPTSVQTGETATPAISQWETDDWEFAGWKEESDDLMMDPAPRLVFGPAPTLEEAQEATSDLKYALETAYFSDKGEDSAKKNEEQRQIGLFENNTIIPAMPRGVVQAFSLLQSSPEAQTVVASLASDKAIWDAVMKNEKVMEFYRNNQSSLTENIFEDAINANSKDKNSEDNNECETVKENNGFVGFVNVVKEKAMVVVNNVSDLLQNVFGTKADGTHASESEESSTFQSFMTPQNAFWGLAIAVIFIVLLKRPPY